MFLVMWRKTLLVCCRSPLPSFFFVPCMLLTCGTACQQVGVWSRGFICCEAAADHCDLDPESLVRVVSCLLCV